MSYLWDYCKLYKHKIINQFCDIGDLTAAYSKIGKSYAI